MTIPVRRLGLPALLAAALLAGLLLTATAPRAEAAISSTERALISWMNADRAALGLRPLREWSTLSYLAGLRAYRMASANVLSHTVGGSLGRQLAYKRVRAWRYGEDIGYSSYPRGIEAARHIYRMWKASPIHWAQMMSRSFNYVGSGLAYRSSNGRTFASLVFTESPDHTGVLSRITGASRSGDDVSWAWTGWDVALQTHTAGLANFDVQYRVDRGTWHTVRYKSTARTVTLANRAGGHAYGLRVRGRDRAGNLGPWTPETRIWVP